ncbi:error-prone DNA polymerase [Parvularcula dongshanensis]|uniref:Error-prone DNA polymerase n=1 Tax=Parvularcula dongshanensis TaxID=1173995 RepID=A0A840I2Y7_9PROT|nr:error-prone DNA polymerase [Parvularcula dongshanensis]
MSTYCELQCTSHFSFLRGASSCEELFAQAAMLGLPALGVVDRNSVAGLVRAHEAAKVTGVRAVLGCRLDLDNGTSLLVYPQDKPAWSRLCRLLTIGKRRAGKGACDLGWEDVAEHREGMQAVLIQDDPGERMTLDLARLRETFGDRAYIALTRRFLADESERLARVVRLARAARVGTIATNDVLYHAESRRVLQDVVTAIREGCTVEALGRRRERTAGRFLKPPEEMARLFEDYPEAVANTEALTAACAFSLSELQYQYPDEEADGQTAAQRLRCVVEAAIARRYPAGCPDDLRVLIERELALIAKLSYEPYFLTVHRIVEAARNQLNVLCQGRGSAANSAVCYVLGVTSIDPVENKGLLFERFVSEERGEPPDIDIDFDAGRREEVIQWVYETYGRDHAALTATVVRYRARGAIREVGKVLGLPEDVTAELSKLTWAWDEAGVTEAQAASLKLNLADRRLRMTLDLARQLMGAPRHLSQHPGGFVLTKDPLIDLVPIEPAAMERRQVIEWDKDDIDALHFMKVDVLGLGMLGAMSRFFDLLREHKGEDYDLTTVPDKQEDVYEMICKADTLGVFQIESRAQMAMLPRMKPRSLDDLTVEVAVVRPGPIQGQMVHPYLKRREGLEKTEYPTPEFKEVLEKTLGIPLFQEQAMSIAVRCGGFTPGEADELRRAMATFKYTGGVSHFRDKLITGMVKHGLSRDFAERTFAQLEGFGSYGFPMSHAASFARIAYVSSWAKCRHPDVFLAALLNAQPMGFYAPAQLVWCARNHGVEVRPPCVNASRWDCTLEEEAGPKGWLAVRMGLRMVSGLPEAEAARLVLARTPDGARLPYQGPEDAQRRAGLSAKAIRKLVEGDAFAACGLTRRGAGWQAAALRDTPLPLFEAADDAEGKIASEAREEPFDLPAMTTRREVVEDYVSTGLSLRAHPLVFMRRALRRKRVLTADEAHALRDKSSVRVAGLVLSRQRPGSAKGVMFLTLEDETGPVNVIVWPSLFERYRRTVLTAGMIGIEGQLQREGEIRHVVARRLVDLSSALARLGDDAGLPTRFGRGDEARSGGGPDRRGLPPGSGARLQPITEDYNRDFQHRTILGEPDAPQLRVRPRNFR